MYKMQCGDKEVFRNFFIFGNPKFVSPCAPSSQALIADYSKEATEHQINVSSPFVNRTRNHCSLN